MIAVDTNVLLRYVIQDDRTQFEHAERFFRKCSSEEPAFVSLVVLAEFAWVLRRHYRYPPAQVLEVINALLDAAELTFEMEETLAPYFARLSSLKGDVADHLIAFCSRRAGCSHTITFDKAAARSVPGMELLS